MNTATRKAKGKRLQKFVCKLILKYHTILEDKDVKSIRMGRKGEDIQLSEKAKILIPYSIECKNQEKMKYLWDAYEQSLSNANQLEPMVVLKINNKKPLVLIDAEHFFWLQSKIIKSG
ncbi:MAG: hypothetical protein CFH33_01674 [Alphaproteobacteria bacterium MarineAlpha9_Bin3]|nr:MAG: hypothetical protein CFH33_01674 [Alphaproteobacteria bacterium MarineAlpha9_Bin3]|tara:strand:- start:5742 stop:6095 length:354 start_codon:yes stop_codon:yes gene_type:complete